MAPGEAHIWRAEPDKAASTATPRGNPVRGTRRGGGGGGEDGHTDGGGSGGSGGSSGSGGGGYRGSGGSERGAASPAVVEGRALRARAKQSGHGQQQQTCTSPWARDGDGIDDA
jgi:hypothetical protein